MGIQLENEALLSAWLEEADILFSLSKAETKTVLDYLENRNLRMETEGTVLYLCDTVNKTKDKTTIDDVIDTVCEANYELIEKTVHKIANAVKEADVSEQEQYLSKLMWDEKVLDGIFARMRYQKKITQDVQSVVKGKDISSKQMSR
ncbi:MAG: hypothetical protein ACK5MN_02790 [Lachnospiraceae bacterium]